MRLTLLFEKLNHLTFHEKRCVTDEFIELVFYNADLADWYHAIHEMLGAPRKAADMEPCNDDLQLTAHTGGIRFEQTLFEKRFDDGTVIAKFWPWKDHVHTTLRMALLLH